MQKEKFPQSQILHTSNNETKKNLIAISFIEDWKWTDDDCTDWSHYLYAIYRTGSGHEKIVSLLPLLKITISFFADARDALFYKWPVFSIIQWTQHVILLFYFNSCFKIIIRFTFWVCLILSLRVNRKFHPLIFLMVRDLLGSCVNSSDSAEYTLFKDFRAVLYINGFAILVLIHQV